ncbi:hypothetical protein MOQ_003561 [Trypanosoma cruzi marinkellei]|uniref:Uncharacterized protein n=1 Tax=Trypanosoma cruzi marinkellei TaxID=85056 RepID=K2NCM9_TRYCR|nr:hypothetical protein MOQ_003561 [Trypanosoma cruzi marinkellei]
MASVDVEEFDLLQYLHLSSLKDENQLTEGERQALEEQRHRELDEAQYVGHLAQQEKNRIREQFLLRGRAPKPRSYVRDAADKYGLFWFGRGKYEGDSDGEEKDVDGNAATCGLHQKQRKEENLGHEDSESEDISDEERFKVWRPVEAPPLRRDKAGIMPFVPASSRREVLRKAPLPTRKPVPAVETRRYVLTPPWAEHYHVDSDVRKGGRANQVKRQHELYKHGVLPRGVDGIDEALRHARNAQDLLVERQKLRMREAQQRNQRELKNALEEQIMEKKRLQLSRREEEFVQIYGPNMRHILDEVFGRNLNVQQQLHFVENADDGDNDNDLFLKSIQTESPQQIFRDRSSTGESRARESQFALLTACEDQKRRLRTTARGTSTENNLTDDTATPLTPPLALKFRRFNQQSSEKIIDNELQRRESNHHHHHHFSYLSDKQGDVNMAGLINSTSSSY